MSLREETPMAEQTARMMSPLQLAYIGDTVWDLLIRSRLAYQGKNIRNLHKEAITLVNAHAQSVALRRIEAVLTEAEGDVFRRGRNAHAHHAAPKNQDVTDYRVATGLEALVGYLYLTGQEERLLHLFKLSQEES